MWDTSMTDLPIATDTFGNPWALVSSVRPGSLLVADGSLPCIPKGTVLLVQQIYKPIVEPPDALFVKCSSGSHFLDGQIEDDGLSQPHYLGFYLAAQPASQASPLSKDSNQ